MKYRDYTDPPRAGTRKAILRREYDEHGEVAMRKLNKLFKHPIGDATLATWLSHWRWLEKATAA